MQTSTTTLMPQNAGTAPAGMPLKLDKAQLRVLHTLHAEFAPRLAAALRDALRNPQVTLQSLSETTPEQRGARDDGNFTLRFSARKSHAGAFVCAGDLALLALDRLLDCDGTLAAERRAPSEIEAQLLMGVMEPVLAAYTELWSRNGQIAPEIEGIGAEYQAGEPLYEAVYHVTVGQITSRFVLVLRLASWQDSLARCATRPDMRAAGPQNIGLLSALGDCQLPARVLLGGTRMTVFELLGLRAGDILCLNQPQDTPLTVEIGGRARLAGPVHVRNGRYVLTVNETLPGEVA